MKRNSLRLVLAVALALGFGASRAAADFSFNLDAGNSSGLGSGPFATITVHVINNTSAKVTFTADSGYAFVDGSSLALNVAAGITSSNPTSNGEALTLAPNLPANVDGWGKFNVIYDQPNSSNPATLMTVDLTGSGFLTGNTSFSNQNILVANSNGAVAAAHILVVGSQNGFTGYASGSGGGATPPVNDTPAPPAVILFGVGGLGFAGFSLWSRRRRLSAVAA